MEELEQRGINPFKVDVYGVERSYCIGGVDEPALGDQSSTFDEPVKIVKLHYEEEVIPVIP